MAEQLELHFGPYRNSAMFSAHWLKNRLPLEPEWEKYHSAAEDLATKLMDFWKIQKSRVDKYGSEQTLEQAFIQPVMNMLGWKLSYQTYLDGRKPDYALFLSDSDYEAALNVDRKSSVYWSYPAVVADAKAWEVSLDRSMKTGSQREYPPEQIEWYLDRSRLDYGILTNGRLWRVVPRLLESHQGRFSTFFEFDLEKFLTEWSTRLQAPQRVEDALYFLLFFGPAGYSTADMQSPLVQRAKSGSSAYRIGVGEDLRQRAFEAVRMATDGLLSFSANKLNPTEHLHQCHRQSFTLVYRLLFIMFAEDRGLLPYATNKKYRDNHSLSRIRDDVAETLDSSKRNPTNDYSRKTFEILADLRSLFNLVDVGKHSYGVHAYNGGLFDSEANPFLERNQISDWHLSRIIDQLGRAVDPGLAKGGLFRVDYRDLAIQHLGSIYEGLLELEPRTATVPMKVVSKRSKDRIVEKTIPASLSAQDGFQETGERYEIGQVFLETNKGERRASGSYYTPDHIVNHIVEHSLRPLCERIDADLKAEIFSTRALADAGDKQASEKLLRLHGEYDDRVLKLRVLDPAMGSGHFLLRACGYLAEQIATNPLTADDASGESSLTYWKRRVSESCLFGVDLNDMAVELAKLALWLETIAVDRPLTFLDHHFRCGNSLVGAKIVQLGALPDEQGLFSKHFMRSVEAKIPQLLKTLAEIEQLPSRETSQVKKKEDQLKKLEIARSPFRDVADIWCSVFALPETARVHGDDYRRLIDEIKVPAKFGGILAEEVFQRVRKVSKDKFGCFHWELEYPEAFFEGGGRKSNAGFDAVIGNPPYDVLSELESGRDLAAFRAFIHAESTYTPSLGGKNNLYKLFVCRALDLIAENGYLGFITPMAILGDLQAAELRKTLISKGTFTIIEAFPQKDDPKRRVFAEAKLSTAAFVYQKCSSPIADTLVFTLRVHPGRDIEVDSPHLRMKRCDIPLYDPSNCTITPCSQEDLDLAVRIMQTGRMRRMSEVVTSFQGEINEKTDGDRHLLSIDSNDGPLVLRGSNICLYAARNASQGDSVFLRINEIMRSRAGSKKLEHIKEYRVGFQRSAPQNNFRRIIACQIAPNNPCFDTVSYIPESRSSVPLRLLIAMLNSKLLEWYFLLGSTNSKVNEYQFINLPFPFFADSSSKEGRKLSASAIMKVLSSPAGSVDAAIQLIEPLTKNAPFDPVIAEILISSVERIETIEAKRGEIARRARSALAPTAQRYQDFIDRTLFAMAGLSSEESEALEHRLKAML